MAKKSLPLRAQQPGNRYVVSRALGKDKDVTVTGLPDVDISGMVTEGSLEKVVTTDPNVESLLNGIIKELKKMNLHLSLITDVFIKDSEVE